MTASSSPWPSIRRTARATAAVALALTACSDPEPLSFGNGHAPGDAAYAGQQLFLTHAWGTEVLGSWPPADFMLSLMDEELFADQYSKFGFIPDPADDFPVGFKRGSVDPTRVAETCGICHVAALPDGTLWLGAPNTRLDFARFRKEVDARWVAAGNPSMMTAVEQSKALIPGPGRFGAESGDYPYSVPADFPPYFTLGERTHLNYMGTGQDLRSEVHFSVYSAGAGSPTNATARVKLPSAAVLGDFLGFFGAMRPPPAPAGLDAAKITRGREVFAAARCDSCHHVGQLALDGVVTLDTSSTARERLPGEDPAFPTGSITTSGVHRVLQDGDPDQPSGMEDEERVSNLLLLVLEQNLAIRRTDGYRVGDLRGLAYTAPYLHNGSVPTLEDLLRPATERPTQWRRGDFLVDTTVRGNGNGGHEFGVTLPEADKAALVEYLKSLE